MSVCDLCRRRRRVELMNCESGSDGVWYHESERCVICSAGWLKNYRGFITIKVTPFPERLSASNLVNWLSRYGIWPVRFFGSLNDAMQYPKTMRLVKIIDCRRENFKNLHSIFLSSYLLLILLASSSVLPSLCVFFVISDPARSETETQERKWEK